MSKLTDLNSHIHSIEEIKSILNAMKNLSLVEMNKVYRYIINQLEIDDVYSQALIDFNHFFNFRKSQFTFKGKLFILIGSERGFCGGFNEKILDLFNSIESDQDSNRVLIIGRKLALKIQNNLQRIEKINGPNIVEEVPEVISNLGNVLLDYTNYSWHFIYNESLQSDLKTKIDTPLELKETVEQPAKVNPPFLYLKPREFYSKLMDHYLISALYRIFYLSFLAENKERLRRMDAAVEKIDKNIGTLKVKKNALRQEEITQELELILLSTGENF